jgi:membrane protein/epoxyqueuosine reductase
LADFPDPIQELEAPHPAASGAVQAYVEPAARSKWYQWRKDGTALITYLLDSEVHTFAFSVAANAIISFIPFIVLLYTITHSVIKSTMMADVVTEMVHYFLPSNQAFVAYQLSLHAPPHGVQIFSLIMILISCTGIFLPLEVALAATISSTRP